MPLEDELGDILQKKVDDPWFYIDDEEMKQWKYLKHFLWQLQQ